MGIKSQTIYNKLCEDIPGGVNSPVRSFKYVNHPPMVVERGVGPLIYDADGHEFIDYCGSWGALIHGHCHPVILEAVKKRMEKGTSFGITTEIEGLLAAKIKALMPSIEKVRFVSTGTEATMSAIRLARGFTGRKKIVKFSGHYHGHADFFLVQAGSGVMNLNQASSAGIPEEITQHTICIPFNDIQTLEQVFKDNEIAAVILEPIAGNMGTVPATPEFMDAVVHETRKSGALLIYDEVMTGFRVAKGGAQSIYGVKPDLTCLAKIIGGGFPAAAFGGRAEIMNRLAPLGPVYQAGTLSGNPVAMEAGLQALQLLDTPGFYEELERKTNSITEPVRQILKNDCIQQAGSMFTLFFGKQQVSSMEEARTADTAKYADFFQYMYKNGVYIPPLQQEAWFVSNAHEDKHLIKTRDLILNYY